MKNFLRHQLSAGFFLLSVLILIFTVLEKAVFSEFRQSIALGTFGGEMVRNNDNYLFYLPFALLCFTFAWVYYAGREGKKLYLNKIPGYVHIGGTMLFILIYMYGFFALKFAGDEMKNSLDDVVKAGLVVSFLGLLAGQLVFIVNLIVGVVRFAVNRRKDNF